MATEGEIVEFTTGRASCASCAWGNKEGIQDYSEENSENCDAEDREDMTRTEKDRQCTYNVALRRVCATTVVVEKQ